MKNNFTASDLVSFGSYLLSEDRRKLIVNHPGFKSDSIQGRLKQVSDADIQNWKKSVSNISNQ